MPSGTAYLDTTAVVNLIFLAAKKQREVVAAAAEFEHILVSNYVVFELAKGPMNNLLILHRKLQQLQNLSDVVAYAARCNRSAYLSGTILGALTFFLETTFRERHNLNDREMLLLMRAQLKTAILNGWRRLGKHKKDNINEIGCTPFPSAPTEGTKGELRQDLKGVDCGNPSYCGVKAYCVTHRSQLTGVRNALVATGSKKPETERRIKALRQLYRPGVIYIAKDCYACGDALIAHEASLKADAVITSNKSDFPEICSALGLQVVIYG